GLIDKFSATSLLIMNSPVADAVASAKMKWYHQHFSSLIRSTPLLNDYQKHFTIDSSFWNKRNHVMADHIINFSRLYAGQNIVIITGHYHRYYLRELLIPQQDQYNFVIKEFYE
ncbi:MAG: hypothetical protein JWM28_942, partial [Chitinophagaceae bacterium]|nr:hypothetical protein [Chitinophagaceae bacterium]